MVRQVEKAVIQLAKKAGFLRARDVEGQGIHRKRLSPLVAAGTLERVGRGLYRLANSPITEHHTLAEACKIVPRGVICLLSALSFHKVTTQAPHEVWMAIQRSAWRTIIRSQQMRIVFMNNNLIDTEVQTHTFNGAEVRVFSFARTVVDCFKWRKLVGLDIALEALREFLKHPYGGPAQLMRLAKAARVQNLMKPYIEALSA